MQSAFRPLAGRPWFRPSATRALGLIALIAVLFSITSPADAQFADPITVSGPFIGCFQPDVIYRPGERVSVTFTRAGEVFHTHSGNGFASFESVSQSPLLSSGAGQMETGALILVYVVYEETDPVDGDSEIFLVNNNGGVFFNPVQLTSDTIADRKPQIDLGATGTLAVVWEHGNPGQPTEVHLRVDDTTEVLGDGANPSIASTSSGDIVVAYLRGGSAFSRIVSAGVVGPETSFGSLSGVTSIDVEANPTGGVDAVLVSGGDIYLSTTDGTAAFSRPGLEISAAAVGGADLAFGGGRAVIAYQEATEIVVACDAGAGWTNAIVSTGVGATTPAAVVDGHGYAHVCWAQAGQIRYTNDGPEPQANFVGSPTSGQLPLPVTFDNLTQEPFSTAIWDFGDGTSSTQSSPTHTYMGTGPFSVTLTVIGPSGTDTFVRNNYVTGTLPEDVFEIQDISAFAGQDVLHPVIGTNSDPIQGFQSAILFDDTSVTYNGIDLSLSATQAFLPEFVFEEMTPNGPDSTLIVAIVLDFLEPFDGRAIPAGVRQLLFSIDYTVDFPLGLGTVIPWSLVDGLADPPVDNIFASIEGVSLHPFLLSGETRIDALPTALFRRGDANYDQTIDIGDAIFLLTHFFALGDPPPCPDAGDANDDGVLDIGDAIYDLAFLFSSGAGPPYPFPGVGLDPTEDRLGECGP